MIGQKFQKLKKSGEILPKVNFFSCSRRKLSRLDGAAIIFLPFFLLLPPPLLLPSSLSEHNTQRKTGRRSNEVQETRSDLPIQIAPSLLTTPPDIFSFLVIVFIVQLQQTTSSSPKVDLRGTTFQLESSERNSRRNHLLPHNPPKSSLSLSSFIAVRGSSPSFLLVLEIPVAFTGIVLQKKTLKVAFSSPSL